MTTMHRCSTTTTAGELARALGELFPTFATGYNGVDVTSDVPAQLVERVVVALTPLPLQPLDVDVAEYVRRLLASALKSDRKAPEGLQLIVDEVGAGAVLQLVPAPPATRLQRLREQLTEEDMERKRAELRAAANEALADAGAGKAPA